MVNSWGATGICESCGESDCHGECRHECYQTGEHKFIEDKGETYCEFCNKEQD